MIEWATDWWGVTFTASNEKDIKTLRDFIDNLTDSPTESYDDGDIELKVSPGKLVVEINR